jgi:translation initiation factor IF-3
MAEARQAQEARKAEAKANPGKSQNAADAEIADEIVEDTVEAPAEASAEA